MRQSPYVEAFESIEDIAGEYGGDYNFRYHRKDFKKSVWPERFPGTTKILNDLKGAKILVAWYGHGGYEGSSFVLYQKDGELWEVNGSHCSCGGLEDQWSPEKTSWAAIAKRKWSDTEDPRYIFGTGCEGYETTNQMIHKLIQKHGGDRA